MIRSANDPAHFRRVAQAHERAVRCTGEDDPECATPGCFSAVVDPGERFCLDCRDARREEPSP